jgi:autotransporter-associated beta strand protein
MLQSFSESPRSRCVVTPPAVLSSGAPTIFRGPLWASKGNRGNIPQRLARAVRAAMERLEPRLLFTWIGATSGATNDAAHNFNNLSNWAGGTIDDSFAGVTLTANTTLYLSANTTTATTGLNLGYTGNFSLTFLSSSTTARTLTLAGDMASSPANQTVTIGDTTNADDVNVVLSSATRTLNTASGEKLVLANVVSGAEALDIAGSGTVLLDGANTFTGGTALASGAQLDINNASALGTGAFTINGGTIDNTSAGAITLTTNNTQTWAGNFTFAGTKNLNLGTGAVTMSTNIQVTTTAGDLTVGGAIGDGGNGYQITQSGVNGTLTLGGNNTFSGGMTFTSGGTAGTLDINSAAAVGTGTFVINTGAVLDNTSSGPITLSNNNSIHFNGDFTFAGTHNLNLGTGAVSMNAAHIATINAGTFTFGGVISGSHVITKAGAGALDLAGANTFSGGVTLSAGTLDINNAAAIGTGTFTINGGTIDNTSGAAITLSNNNVMTWGANFVFGGTNALNLGTGAVTLSGTETVTANASTLTVGGVIGDGGSGFGITKASAGALILNAANTFTGATTISAGSVRLGNVDAAQDSTVSVGVANGLTFSSGIGSFTIGGLSGSSNDALADTGAAAVTLTIGNNGSSNTYSGVLSGSGALKLSGGTETLSGASTYSGGTTISGGTLLADNSSGSGTGTGAVTVSSGGTLGGTGTASGAVTVNSGGNLSPGSGGTSIFNTGNLVLAAGSNLNIALNGNTAGSGYDQVNVTGTVNVTGSNLVLSGTRSARDGSVLEIIANDASDAVTGTFQGLAQGGTTVFNGVTYGANYSGGTGNDVALTAEQPTTSTAITSNNNPSTYNTSVTFTATVSSGSSGTPTGTVTFFDGATSLGNGTLNGADQATLSISSLSVGSHSITASYGGDSNFASSTSSVLTQTVTAAAAAKLVYSVQPSNVAAGAAIGPSIVVDVEDQFGNIVTTNSSNVTLATATGPGSATGTLTVAATNGVATFNNVKLDTAGSYTLTATDGSLTSATSSSFTVSAAAASKVAYGTQPSNVTAGVADNPSIVVDVEDQFGNIVTGNSSNVTLAVASGPGSATGTLTVAAASGVATFSNVKLDAAGNYTLSAADGALTSATSGSFTVAAAAASKLAYGAQPSNVAAGAANSPSIVVDVEDQFGNIVTGNSSNITVAVASGPGSATGTLTVAASGGVATFSNVIIDTAGSYTLSATDGSLTSATSGSFAVSAGAASKLVYGTQPSNVTAGVAISPSIVVDVEDQFGNIVTSNSSNVTVAVASGPGSATGTLTVAATSGVATFSNVKLDTAGSYTLSATGGALTSATSNSFTVSAAAASKLVYGTQPSNVTAGAAISPPIVVDVEDQFGNIVTGNSSNVTVAVASGPGSATGTLTVAASSGVATFNNVKLSTIGSYTLSATDGSLTSATSNSFTVSDAAASKLAFGTQPSNVAAGAAISPSIVVDVEDQFGNIITTDSSNVTLVAASGPGSLSGTLTVAAVNGVATFSNVKVDTAGSYTISASDGSLTAATSGSFTVSPAAASKLVYGTQPSNVTAGVAISPSIVVDVEDQFGNIVTSNSSNVTLAVATGPGSATGTLTVAASGGVATFSNVKLDTAGNYTLSATDGALTSATSNSMTVSPAAASKLIYGAQPSNVTAGVADSPSIVVDVEDQFGNIVASNSSNVTVAVATGPGSATGTLTIAASGGVATFSNVTLDTAGNYTLSASDGGLTAATSGSFTVAPAAASKLVYGTQPSDVTAGVAISPSIVVDVEDQFGNIVTGNSSSVTLAVASGSGSATGTLTVAASGGVATFNNVKLDTAGNYTLSATDGGLTAATSTSFTASPAAASKLVYATNPSNATAGVANSPSIAVDVEDQFGNIVTSNSSNVTVAVASGPGSASGTLTVAAANGVATFGNVKLDTAGNYTLSATDGALTSATSGSFTVSPAAASKLVYGTQPSNATAGAAFSPSIVVDVEDQFGNIVTSNSSSVTLAVASGPGSAGGTLTVAASGGVATFGNVNIDTAGSYTLSASDGGLTSATSNSFTVAPAAASKLVYATGPSNVTAGVAISPSIVVDIEDQFGNIVTGNSSDVTLAVGSGPGSATGTLTVAGSSGVATFSNVKIDTAGGYTLLASDGGLSSATSGSFTVSAAAVAKVGFTQQPTNVQPGDVISPAVTVSVEDAFGNVIAGNTSNVTISLASGPGSLSGTLTVAAVNGVATFSDLSVNATGSYSLKATDGSLTSGTSAGFTVGTAIASMLQFIQQPGDVAAGAADSPSITVDVEDQFGNLVTSDSSNVTVATATGPGSASGTLTVAASGGVATFSNVKFDAAGDYTLSASDGSLAPDTSSSFTVSAAAASHLVITAQPSDVTAGAAESPSIVVDVEDQFGNLVTSDSSIVTLGAASGPGSASGTLTVAASNGVATFDDVKLNTAGNYTLLASDGGLASTTSGGFTVSPAAASKLVYGTQPGNLVAGVAASPSITVDVEDEFGNIVTGDSSDVTLAAASGPGNATGILTVAASNGVATFSDVKFDAAGSYTVSATDGSLNSATSGGFRVSAAAPSKLVFGVQPSDVTAGDPNSPAIAVNVEDLFGNVVINNSSDVTLSVASGPGSATGTLTVSASSGIATFSDVVLGTAGTYTLAASDGSLTPATSDSFSIAASHGGPSIAQIASATPSFVDGTTANLSVLGADVSGESILTYTWAATAEPAGSDPVFSLNGTNAAKNSTVTFDEAGNYTFTSTISDGQGGTDTSSVNVVVTQSLTGVALTASPSPDVRVNGNLPLAATQLDQFGNAMAQQLPVTWSIVSGSGTISADGVFTAGALPGTTIVQASAGSFAGTISVAAGAGTAPVQIPTVVFLSPIEGSGNVSTVLENSDTTNTSTPPPEQSTSGNSSEQAQLTLDDTGTIPAPSNDFQPGTFFGPAFHFAARPNNSPVAGAVLAGPRRAAPNAGVLKPAAAQPSAKPRATDAPIQLGPIEITPISRTEILRDIAQGQSPQWNQDVATEVRLKLRVGLVSAIGSGAISVYLLWLIRGGGVLASLLSSAPVWKLVDPFFVLPRRRLPRTFWKRRKKKDLEDPEDRLFGKVEPK